MKLLSLFICVFAAVSNGHPLPQDGDTKVVAKAQTVVVKTDVALAAEEVDEVKDGDAANKHFRPRPPTGGHLVQPAFNPSHHPQHGSGGSFGFTPGNVVNGGSFGHNSGQGGSFGHNSGHGGSFGHNGGHGNGGHVQPAFNPSQHPQHGHGGSFGLTSAIVG